MSQEGGYSRTSDPPYGQGYNQGSEGGGRSPYRRSFQGNTETRYIHVQDPSTLPKKPINDAVNTAFDDAHVKERAGVSPELIAQLTQQITSNVIQQLKTTGVTEGVPQTPHTALPPPPTFSTQNYQQPKVSSPSSPSAGESPPTRIYTPPSPEKHSERHDSTAGRSTMDSPSPTTRMRAQSNVSPGSVDNTRGQRIRPPPPRRQPTAEETTTLEKIWGKLFDADGRPTPRLGQVFRGLAMHLIDDTEPKSSLVVTPTKMLAFYESTSIQDEKYPWSEIFDDGQTAISRMYRQLNIQHHLVQEDLRHHERPDIPGLTPQGFERWLTLMIQAHPEEEYERLQKALINMPISNPDDKKERFPKDIPRRLFPKEADHELRYELIAAVEKHAKIQLGRQDEQPTPRAEQTPLQPGHRQSQQRRGSDAGSHNSFTDGSVTSDGPYPRGGIERERKPYSKIPDSSTIDDTNTPVTSTPIERERKPYSAAPGGGKLHNDFPGSIPLSSTTPLGHTIPPPPSGQPPLQRSTSSAARPVNIPPPPPNGSGIHRLSTSEYASPLNAPHLRDPTARRRNHSPLANDMRRSDTDIRGYPSSSYEPTSYMPREGYPASPSLQQSQPQSQPQPQPPNLYATADPRYDDDRRYGRGSEIRRDEYVRGGSPNRRVQDPPVNHERRGTVGSGHVADEEYYRRPRDERPRGW